jgi:hypothetical protein
MYYNYCGLPYGKEDKTLLINNEWAARCFEIQSGVVFFLII